MRVRKFSLATDILTNRWWSWPSIYFNITLEISFFYSKTAVPTRVIFLRTRLHVVKQCYAVDVSSNHHWFLLSLCLSRSDFLTFNVLLQHTNGYKQNHRFWRWLFKSLHLVHIHMLTHSRRPKKTNAAFVWRTCWNQGRIKPYWGWGKTWLGPNPADPKVGSVKLNRKLHNRRKQLVN